MKFTLISHEEFAGSKLTLEFDAVSLSDVLPRFEDFLRGSGFVFDGVVDIVEFEDSDVDYEIGEKVFDNLVAGLNGTSAVQDLAELCSVCGISKARMEGHTCWDEKCPMKEYNAN
jgi:hypothetical protein